jgi:hypothetical protein
MENKEGTIAGPFSSLCPGNMPFGRDSPRSLNCILSQQSSEIQLAHSPQLLKEIERAVSRERLKRYLAATSQDLDRAIFLYEQNVALSEMTFGLLHGLEVAVRNSMHDQLSLHFKTPYWFNKAHLSNYSQDKIAAAVRDAGGPSASPGKVVAELMFGFWTDLAAQRYHWTLWQPCLSVAFPSGKLARPVIHRRLEDIRWLRNRVAHHEPILTSGRSLYAGHQKRISFAQLTECGDWISPSVGGWLRTHFRFAEATAILEAAATSGWAL